MNLREAKVDDIKEIQRIRWAVKENRLSDPSLVPDSDVENYIINRGKGWVWKAEGVIRGFSIIDMVDKNVWALFIDPEFEKLGIGRLLHDNMVNWYFSKTNHTLWLSTAPGTRAESFYRKAGWKDVGFYGKGEIRFEMNASVWQILHPVQTG